jgi:hypothetical protein
MGILNEGIQGSRSADFRFRLENSHPLLRAGRRRKCHLQTSIEGKFCSEYALGWQVNEHLWLQNPNNVVLQLQPAREGLILTLRGSGVIISMD